MADFPMADFPLPSKALNDAFAEYEAHLTKTADKRIKGRQSAIRYNRKRFIHGLKRLQSAKVVLVKDDEEGEVAKGSSSSTRSKAAKSITTTTTSKRTIASSTSLKENASSSSSSSSRHDSLLRRLTVVESESAKIRTVLSESAAADDKLEKILQDPRRRKIDANVEDIVKELDRIDDELRHGTGKVKSAAKT